MVLVYVMMFLNTNSSIMCRISIIDINISACMIKLICLIYY